MKTFICIKTSLKHDKNGNPRKTMDIYRVKNNIPVLLKMNHCFDYTDTAQECRYFLSDNGFIPKRLRNAGISDTEKAGYRIIEL